MQNPQKKHWKRKNRIVFLGNAILFSKKTSEYKYAAAFFVFSDVVQLKKQSGCSAARPRAVLQRMGIVSQKYYKARLGSTLGLGIVWEGTTRSYFATFGENVTINTENQDGETHVCPISFRSIGAGIDFLRNRYQKFMEIVL